MSSFFMVKQTFPIPTRGRARVNTPIEKTNEVHKSELSRNNFSETAVCSLVLLVCKIQPGLLECSTLLAAHFWIMDSVIDSL